MVNLVPDVCEFLADEEAAMRVYDLLAPFGGSYAEAPMEGCFGSVDRGLGVVATTLGRYEDAERHFTSALEIERGMGARLWMAHVRHDHAQMLFRKGDTARATDLQSGAIAGYRELGMNSWAERADALG